LHYYLFIYLSKKSPVKLIQIMFCIIIVVITKVVIFQTGFLNGKNARLFMGELWTMLDAAQSNPAGIPQELIDKKKDEIKSRKVSHVIRYNVYLLLTFNIQVKNTVLRLNKLLIFSPSSPLYKFILSKFD